MYIINSIKSIAVYMIVAVLLAFSLSALVATSKVSAQVVCDGLTGTEMSKCQACKGSGGQNYSGGVCSSGPGSDPETKVTETVQKVINIFSWIVGVASVIMIMVGGFKYITSQGDANSISSAKNTILYAIIGLVIVGLAQLIVQFVLNKI